ncbi:single-stranded DNA-binding protein [Arsenicicoccus sp. oral taxon 190]|uniref:single-stranded DNA-binding protein n=1 Tax=Arsenicicoccus sp. oral taxon 190 TaxID=1658671 RepID=UPI00067B0C19|nr:single-stranded DNA-binding protein [Arsenicicoccus sp. oral taxon 190]
MHETIVTITGNLVADPELRITSKGEGFATFRLACTERRRDANGVWTDGHTNFVRVTTFRSLAQNVMGTLKRGNRCIVQGRLRVADWESGERRGTSVEIDAHAVGPDLTFAYADVTRGTWSAVPDRLTDTAVQQVHAQDAGLPEPDEAPFADVEDRAADFDGEPEGSEQSQEPQGTDYADSESRVSAYA